MYETEINFNFGRPFVDTMVKNSQQIEKSLHINLKLKKSVDPPPTTIDVVKDSFIPNSSCHYYCKGFYIYY